MSKNLSLTIPERPWEELPALMGLPSIGEMAAQPLYSAPQNGQKHRRRTAPYGLDFLGRPFQRGDILLSRGSAEYGYVEVEEIFLDDTKGQPYSGWSALLLDSRTRDVFTTGIATDPNRRDSWRRVMWPVDPEWRAPLLGLTSGTQRTYSNQDTPQGFEVAEGQSFRVRVVPVAVEGATKITLPSDHLSVFGEPLDARTIALHRKARLIPKGAVEIPIN